MRIDKFAWFTRYYKTRSIATDACKKGQVKLNGVKVKASKDVFVGDKLSIYKNQIQYELQILVLPKSRLGAKLVDDHRKDLTPKEAFENQEFLKYSKDYYRNKGTGRPTKKDRRDIDDYVNTDREEDNS